jgi:hypothetical protein
MNELQKEQYNLLLRGNKWQRKRQAILSRDGNRCRACGKSKNLHVHHRQYHTNRRTGKYLPPWQYSGKYLITLCGKCHQSGHGNYTVPVKYV